MLTWCIGGKELNCPAKVVQSANIGAYFPKGSFEFFRLSICICLNEVPAKNPSPFLHKSRTRAGALTGADIVTFSSGLLNGMIISNAFSW